MIIFFLYTLYSFVWKQQNKNTDYVENLLFFLYNLYIFVLVQHFLGTTFRPSDMQNGLVL